MLLTLNLNPDGRDESVFVASGSSSVESLLPVQLKDDEFEEYVHTFFPKRRQPKGFTTSYKHYYELAVYMSKLSSFFAAIKAHLNAIALEATMYDEATVARTAASKFARIVIASTDEGAQTLMVKDYIEGIRGKHVIVKGKDGFDILFSGLPGTCMKSPLKVGEFPTNNANYMYGEMQRTGTFDNKVFKMALAVAQSLNKEFAGQPSTIESSFKRKINKLPLSFDMSALLGRLNKVAGSFIPNIDLFGGVTPPKADPVMVQGLQKYLNLLVVQEAEKSSVDYMSRTPPPPPLSEETSSSSSYSVSFNSNIGFSFYIALPKAFASFITQTPASSEIPMVPLNTWVNIWTSALMKVPRQKTKGGDRVTARNAPRYVLSASQTSLLVERRKALGFFAEPGRINEDGIFVSDKGRFNWCPPSSELALENAKNYEALMEEALRLSYEAGTPLSANQIGETNKVFGVSSPAYKEKIRDIKTKISAYAGSLQTFSWDYNVILTSSATDPERLVSYNLAGTAVPNDLSIADYLRKPFAESMAILFNASMAIDDGGNRSGKVTEATFGKGGSALSMLKSTIFQGVHKMYRYLLSEKKVPVLQDLVLAASKELNLKSLELEDSPYDANIYRSVLDNTLGVKPEFNQVTSTDQIEAQTRALFMLLGAAIRDSSGAPGTNLAKETFKGGGDVKDDDHYFNPEFFTLGEFKNVYAYLGGRVFQKLCEHILKVPRKEFLVINPANAFSLPDFQVLVKEIMPAVVILGKYAVQSEEIIERANALEESNHRNQSITASDIVMPGSKNGFQIFPHQLKVHQYLQNRPRYAVLDVAPGGGKCLTGDHLVPTTSGILTLRELWGMSDEATMKNGFQNLNQVSIVSHERTIVPATKAFKSEGKTHKVVLSDGSSIQGLPEHKLWALESGSLDEEFIQLSELKKGMWVSKAIGDEIYGSRTPTLEFNGRSMKLSEDLAELFGWLVSEGYTPVGGDNCRTVSFEQHHAANRARYIEKFEVVFGPDTCHQIESRPNSVEINRDCPEVTDFIRNELVLGTSSFKEVPRCIRVAPKRYQVAFLRSLWEGDGSVWHGSTGVGRGRLWKVEYSTISLTLAAQVKIMMENMGIPVILRTGAKYYSNNHDHPKRICKLSVSWKDLPKFAECIGFLSEEKISKLQSAVAKTDWATYDAKQTSNIDVGGKWNRVPAYELTRELLTHLKLALSNFEYDVPKNSRGAGGRTEVWSVPKLLRDNNLGRYIKPAHYSNGATNRYSVLRVLKAIQSLEPIIKSSLLKNSRVKVLVATLNHLLSKYWVTVESSRKDSSAEVFDLSVPGPHSYSVGGVYGHNTILLLADAASIVGKGLIKGPPCIFAPNGLVRNWVEDLHKVTEGKWNVIPITTSVYRTWGDERLTKLIKDAPRNTIIVMSTSVLKLDKYPIVIGNHVETVSAVLEFARKFGFEYIALDESHRGKNVNSGVHKALRQVMVASTVKYVRLATGTLIKDRLTDVVGQAALFNAQIFRTAEEYEAENSEQLGTYTVMTWKPNTPELARAQLSKHAAVITAKKKEWAFMLPRPIETFIPVRMEKTDAEGGLVHQMMYDAILKETLEEIKQDKDVMALLQGHSEDDDDEDDDAPQALPTDNDLDDATLADLESKLEPYLARLEQLLTDPVGDPFGEVYFGGMAKDNFVSNKVQKCIERIRRNFDKYPWVKGKKYKLKDLTDFNDQRYVLMGEPGKVLTLDDYEKEYESHIDPSKDPRWKLEPQGKVIVFCRYTRTVNAVYKALPPDLKKIAIKFHGEVKNKWEGFDQFRTSPFSTNKDPQILIANEQSITEGHNLQMASRIIRMESPWSPGELDQSSSRIFRPDPSKKFSRENVYLDWIICNGSLEVAKMGRLISKMLVKTQFDEAGNPLYASVAEQQLPLIRMSLETIASVPIISDIQEYIEAYANLVHIQAAEFEDMRQSGPSTMLDVPVTPMFKEARIIEQVPYVPNLEVPDRHDFGLLRLNEYLQDTEDPNVQSILKDRQNLIGSYVHTEFGNGIISRVGLSRPSKVPGISEAEAEAARRITRIDVQLANGDTYSGAPTMIFLATNVTKENVKDFGPTTKLATKRDKALSERARKALERQEAREAKKAAAAAAKTILGLGKKKPKVVEPEPEEEEENLNIELFPVVYNGFLALEGSPEDPEFNLKSYGFKQFGDYAYTIVKDQKSFEALLEYLDSKFSISTPIFRRLEDLQDSFQTGRGRKFNVELAPVSEFKNFYLLRHRLSGKDQKGRAELKIYPVVLNGSLMLTVDIATNPVIKRHLNKVIPGTRNLKFEEASGLNIKFFNSRSELVAFVRSIRAEGVVVTNFAELKQELTDLKTTQRV